MYNKEIGSYMTLKYDFEGIRVLDDRLTPVTWNIKINLAGIDDQTTDDETYRNRLSVTYQKINVWLEYFLKDVLLVGTEDSDINYALYTMDLDNTFVQLPGLPTDDVFIEALHSKLSVLGGTDLLIGEISLDATDTRTTFHFSHVALGYNLPTQEEWTDIEEVVHTNPWWERHDCDLWEPSIPEGMTREEMLDKVNTSIILESIVRDIEESVYGTEVEEDDSEAEIISLAAKWKPDPQ